MLGDLYRTVSMWTSCVWVPGVAGSSTLDGLKGFLVRCGGFFGRNGGVYDLVGSLVRILARGFFGNIFLGG